MPRRGYRFIAPVNIPSPKAPTPGGPAIEAAREEVGKPSSFRRWMAIAFLSVAAIAVLLWALWRHPARSTEVIERKLTANSLENGVRSGVVSRDGKFLAYSDNTGLYLKEIRTGETHRVPLPQNFSADVSDWFPDGSHLLVSQEQPGKLSLWGVSVSRCYIDQGLGRIVGNPEVIHWDMQIGTDKSACHQQWLGQQKRVFAREPVAAV